MGPGQLGYLIGTLLTLVVVGAVWLIVAKLIPPLRRRPGVSNLVAAVLVLCAAVANASEGGSAAMPLFAGLLVSGLLWWNYRREARALVQKPSGV